MQKRPFSSSAATLVGLGGVLIWGLAALAIKWARDLPVLQVLSMTFGIGGLFICLAGRLQTGGFGFMRQSARYYIMSVALVLGNNFFYTLGLRSAPIVAANLVNYLWPVLIVLLSVPVLKRPLRWHHMTGALLGLGGTVFLITQGKEVAFEMSHLYGYAFAFAGALCWAIYSVLLRRDYAQVNNMSLGVVFLIAAGLCLALAPVFGKAWRMPQGLEFHALGIMGFGTLACAYLCWNYGAKKGDVRVMGGRVLHNTAYFNFCAVYRRRREHYAHGLGGVRFDCSGRLYCKFEGVFPAQACGAGLTFSIITPFLRRARQIQLHRIFLSC